MSRGVGRRSVGELLVWEPLWWTSRIDSTLYAIGGGGGVRRPFRAAGAKTARGDRARFLAG